MASSTRPRRGSMATVGTGAPHLPLLFDASVTRETCESVADSHGCMTPVAQKSIGSLIALVPIGGN